VANEDQQTQDKDSEQQNDRPLTEKPEVKDEHKEKAQEMRKEYVEERATVIMPGSGGTVAGTAVNEWLDDDGNPKFGEESESEGGKSDGDDSDRGGSDDDKSLGKRLEEDKARNERIVKAHDEAANDEAQNDEAGNDQARDDEAEDDEAADDGAQRDEAKNDG
jgi:hypothetical protein